MNLNERIQEDLKNAMKEKDNFRLSVIRMIKGAIQLAKTNAKDELSDEQIIDVISKQIKMRKDSIIEFKKADREDLVEQNKKEVDILNEYMPEQLSIDEIEKILDEAFKKISPTTTKQLGLIIKEVSPKVKGRADMGEITKTIKNRLEKM